MHHDEIPHSKPFRTADEKEAAVLNIESLIAAAGISAARHERLYRQDLEQVRSLRKQLERMKHAPIGNE